MSTNPTRPRPEARGSGASIPRVPGFFAASLTDAGITAALAAIDRGEVAYPLFDRCPESAQLAHVTFLWRDEPGMDPATAVILSANALVDHENLDSSEFEPVREGLWSITLMVPTDWIASYRITVHRGPGAALWRAETERRAVRLAADAGGPDPLNPRLYASMNGGPVSVVGGPHAVSNEHLAAAQPAAQHRGPSIGGQGAPQPPVPGSETAGHPRLSHHVLWDENCRRERNVWVYQPEAGCLEPGEKTPLAIVHDGATWVRYLNIASSLDRAIAAGALAPIHVMFIDSTNIELRSAELPVAAGTTRSVAEQFLPWARTYFEVSQLPEQTLVSGSSFGGLAAVHAVLEYPQLIGAALAQSPSLWFADLSQALREVDPQVRMIFQAGRYESSIIDSCVEVLEALEGSEAHTQIDFQPLSGGHDWAWWAPMLLNGLCQFFPADRSG